MLDELAALDRDASPAPWHVCFSNDAVCMSTVLVTKNPRVGREFHVHGDEWPPEDFVAVCLMQDPPLASVDDDRWDANARLIAAVRNDLAELLRLARLGLLSEQRKGQPDAL